MSWLFGNKKSHKQEPKSFRDQLEETLVAKLKTREEPINEDEFRQIYSIIARAYGENWIKTQEEIKAELERQNRKLKKRNEALKRIREELQKCDVEKFNSKPVSVLVKQDFDLAEQVRRLRREIESHGVEIPFDWYGENIRDKEQRTKRIKGKKGKKGTKDSEDYNLDTKIMSKKI
jgi:hypothetical protein